MKMGFFFGMECPVRNPEQRSTMTTLTTKEVISDGRQRALIRHRGSPRLRVRGQSDGPFLMAYETTIDLKHDFSDPYLFVSLRASITLKTGRNHRRAWLIHCTSTTMRDNVALQWRIHEAPTHSSPALASPSRLSSPSLASTLPTLSSLCFSYPSSFSSSCTYSPPPFATPCPPLFPSPAPPTSFVTQLTEPPKSSNLTVAQ